MATDPTKRIFVECTHTFFTGGNSGIRRVARNLANNGRQADEQGVRIVPVVWCGAGFVSPRKDLTDAPHMLLQCIRYAQYLIGEAYQRTPPVLRRPFTWPKRGLFGSGIHRLDSELFFHLLGICSFPLKSMFDGRVTFRPGDIVVLVDSTWNSKRMLEYLFQARVEADICLGAMIHDLFPLILPETCQRETVAGFTSWFNRIAPEVDFFVTNSEATSRDLQQYLRDNSTIRPFACPVGAFPLGAELDLASNHRGEAANAMSIWGAPGAMVLSVGTIEPRKNYTFLLDALDSLWGENEDLSLCIVGRPGWKNEGLLKRILTHPKYAQRLFLLPDASDYDLEQAFQRADCLVCCSIAEGFGLPVAEGLMHNLPVLASDIPVFREIGGPGCSYFSLSSPDNLAIQLKKWLEKYRQGIVRSNAQDFRWPDWKESSRLFARVVRELGGRQDFDSPGP